MVSAGRLHELYDIDLDQGIFRHKRAIGRAKKGNRAGYVAKKSGYRVLCVDRVDYFEHNLVWFLSNGSWPQEGYEVDHKDRIRDNNGRSNLRLATRSQNNANMKLRKDNRAGFRGMHFNNEKQKFCVQVTKDGKTHSLGYFESLEAAAEASLRVRKQLFGEFAT